MGGETRATELKLPSQAVMAPEVNTPAKPFIDAHQSGSTVWVDLAMVPNAMRGNGIGRELYRRWEDALPSEVKLVRLIASDTDGMPSNGFWEKMGFKYTYDDHGGILDYEAANSMWKGVNGHKTPEAIPAQRAGDLDEAILTTFTKDNENSSLSLKDIAEKRKGRQIGFIFVGGKLSVFDNDVPSQIPVDGELHGSIDPEHNVVSINGPSGMLVVTLGGTKYNKTTEQIRKVVSREFGREFALKFDTGIEKVEDPHTTKELVLYHGTSTKFYDDGKHPIKRFGLMPDQTLTNWASTGRSLSSQKKAVYLTGSVDQAMNYANKAIEVQGGSPMVLKVTVPTSNLIADDDYVSTLKGDARKSAKWQDSLKAIGQVAYGARIPVSKIEVVKRNDSYIKKGKRDTIPNYDQIALKTLSIKEIFNDMYDLYRELNFDKESQAFNKYPIDEKMRALDRAETIEELEKHAKSIYHSLGGWSDKLSDVEDIAEKLIGQQEKADAVLDELKPALKIIAKHGYPETPSGFNDTWHDYSRGDDEAMDRAQSAFDEINDKISSDGGKSKNEFMALVSDYENAMASVKSLTSDLIYNGAQKIIPGFSSTEWPKWERVHKLLSGYFKLLKKFQTVLGDKAVNESIDETTDTKSFSGKALYHITASDRSFTPESMLITEINAEKAFDQVGKKNWDNPERRTRVRSWLQTRHNLFKDGKAVERFAVMAARYGLDTNNEKVLYDAVVVANWFPENEFNPPATWNAEAIQKKADLIRSEKQVVDKDRQNAETSKKPVMEWKVGKKHYKVFQVNHAQVLVNLARFGASMRPADGQDPEDELKHKTNWCVRFPGAADSYLSDGNGLIITRNGNPIAAMFDSDDQDCETSFVTHKNRPAIKSPALMAEIEPFLKRFRINSMDPDRLADEMKQADVTKLIKIASNKKQPLDVEHEKIIAARGTGLEVRQYIELLKSAVPRQKLMGHRDIMDRAVSFPSGLLWYAQTFADVPNGSDDIILKDPSIGAGILRAVHKGNPKRYRQLAHLADEIANDPSGYNRLRGDYDGLSLAPERRLRELEKNILSVPLGSHTFLAMRDYMRMYNKYFGDQELSDLIDKFVEKSPTLVSSHFHDMAQVIDDRKHFFPSVDGYAAKEINKEAGSSKLNLNNFLFTRSFLFGNPEFMALLDDDRAAYFLGKYIKGVKDIPDSIWKRVTGDNEMMKDLVSGASTQESLRLLLSARKPEDAQAKLETFYKEENVHIVESASTASTIANKGQVRVKAAYVWKSGEPPQLLREGSDGDAVMDQIDDVKEPEVKGATPIKRLVNYLADKSNQKIGFDPSSLESKIYKWAGDTNQPRSTGDMKYSDLKEKDQKTFAQWLRDEGHVDTGTEASSVIKLVRHVKPTEWLVHFTNADPIDIAKDGFTSGTGITGMAATRHRGMLRRYSGGPYAFAFLVDDRDAVQAARDGHYGRNAVIFKAKEAIITAHDGDKEKQVVFDRATAYDIVPLTRLEGNSWFTVGEFGGNYKQAVKHAEHLVANKSVGNKSVGAPIAEAVSLGNQVFYHGTDADTARRVAKLGYMDSSKSTPYESGVQSPLEGHTYFTSDLHSALMYAQRATNFKFGSEAEFRLKRKLKANEEPMCGLIVIDRRAVRGLYPDEDHVIEFLSAYLDRKTLARRARSDGHLAMRLNAADRMVSEIISRDEKLRATLGDLTKKHGELAKSKTATRQDKAVFREELHLLARETARAIGKSISGNSVIGAMGHLLDAYSTKGKVQVSKVYVMSMGDSNSHRFPEGAEEIPVKSKLQEAVVQQGSTDALFLMHVDSIDPYAHNISEDVSRQLGREMATDLANDWAAAVNRYVSAGKKVVIVDQYDDHHQYAEKFLGQIPKSPLITFVRFDEGTESWGWFGKQIAKVIKKLGITEVELGGIWYEPHDDTGCAYEAEKILKGIGVHVKPNFDILGSEEDYHSFIEDDDDEDLDESVRPSLMKHDDYYQGRAIRHGEIGPDGAHFSEPGSSTYHDRDSEKAEVYEYPDAKIADTSDETVLKQLVAERIKQVTDPEHIKALQAIDASIPVSYMEVEELGLDAAAKALGYDGIRFMENDDITDPSTVNIWNLKKIRKVGRNHRFEVEHDLKTGKLSTDQARELGHFEDYPDLQETAVLSEMPYLAQLVDTESQAKCASCDGAITHADFCYEKLPDKIAARSLFKKLTARASAGGELPIPCPHCHKTNMLNPKTQATRIAGAEDADVVAEFIPQPELLVYPDGVTQGSKSDWPDGIGEELKSGFNWFQMGKVRNVMVDHDDNAHGSPRRFWNAIFEKEAVTEATTYLSVKDLAKIIYKAIRQDEAFDILDKDGGGGDWGAGGCFILADAVLMVLKRLGIPGELWGLINEAGALQHAVVKSGSLFIDDQGARMKPALINWFKHEHSEKLRLVALADVPYVLGEIPRSPVASRNVAGLILRAYNITESTSEKTPEESDLYKAMVPGKRLHSGAYWVNFSTGEVRMIYSPLHGIAVLKRPDLFGVTDEAELKTLEPLNPENHRDVGEASLHIIRTGQWARVRLSSPGSNSISSVEIEAADFSKAHRAFLALDKAGLRIDDIKSIYIDELSRNRSVEYRDGESIESFIDRGVTMSDLREGARLLGSNCSKTLSFRENSDDDCPLDRNGSKIEDMYGEPAFVSHRGELLLYHRTNAGAMANIIKTRRWISNDSDDVYFSTTLNGYNNSCYGDAAITVRIKPEFVEVNDQFSNGEISVSVKIKDINRFGTIVGGWILKVDPETCGQSS